MKKIFLILLLVLGLTACGTKTEKQTNSDTQTGTNVNVQTNSDTQTGANVNVQTNYIKDFTFKKDEIPKGYEIKQIDKGAERIGLKTNPGFIYKKYIKELFVNTNVSVVKQVYLSVYSDINDSTKELGIITIEYKSKKDLDSEIKKLKGDDGFLYFSKYNFLVIFGTDHFSNPEINKKIEKFKNRLKLKEISK